MPDPAPLSAFEHIYAGSHPVVDAERDTYAAYLDSFDDSGRDGPGIPPPDGAPGGPSVPGVAQARGTGGFGRSGEAR